MSAERKLMGTTDATGGPANYIEDVFSTWLYTGNGGTQTINNGIDLSGKGGLVWFKARSIAASHALFDTVRGLFPGSLSTNFSFIQQYADITSFNSNGVSFGNISGWVNNNDQIYASWTFRKQAKFFDVVTYTGNGSARTIAHNLGSTPGCIIVKCTSAAQNWAVYHRSQTSASYYTKLNLTDAEASDSTVWNATAPTSSVFSVGTSALTNSNGATYVAYLFAHDAGGFGASGTDNVISCGSYTGNGSATGPTVTLGYEPQYLMIKNAHGTGNWQIIDNMRGMPVGSADATLQANLSNAESFVDYVSPTATGFQITSTSTEVNASSNTYIYIAIRRGPMRTPTSGTSVFSPITVNAAAGTKSTTGFPVDMQIMGIRTGAGNKGLTSDRLRGVSTTATDGGTQLITSSTAAETTANAATLFWDNTGFQMPINYSSSSDIFWNFGRAPGFFDVVCYAGTGVARTVNHNLGVTPEFWIIKNRGSASALWICGGAVFGSGTNDHAFLSNTNPKSTIPNIWSEATTTTFGIGSAAPNDIVINLSGANYVAYLFASCPGVSKVGSYTGNGTSQTINCGFTAGARFVLIKRTDSAGDWYTWDSARGIIAGNDPHLSLNTTAAEVTTNDSIDPDSSGFIVNQVAATNINVSSASYIFLAIA